jgi:hypothetical protein
MVGSEKVSVGTPFGIGWEPDSKKRAELDDLTVEKTASRGISGESSSEKMRRRVEIRLFGD